jgi:hypothetical protein
MIEFAEGPLFRFAFALMVLAALRALLLGVSNAVGAYVTIEDHRDFWHKVRMRVLWLTFPSVILRRAGLEGSRAMHRYHTGLFATSLIFRFTAILVPAFMVEHIYLWEQGLGLRWGTLGATAADTLSVIAIVAGLALFFGRLYSPLLRRIEAPWSFLKPLLLVIPFATGMLAMHPTWSPIDYYVVRLIHTISAALVFVLIGFGRMLTSMDTPLTRIAPDAAWNAPRSPTSRLADAANAPASTVTG